jgi:MFS transporter, ACS family, hexuronate transporter
MANAPQQSGTTTGRYQIMLVALLSIHFGIVFFDRNTLNFLMPFVQPELGLSNTQVGVLAGALSLSWAFAAFGIGFISDRTGSRKAILVLATLAFAACSVLGGLASSFLMLLGSRLLMGFAEGGIMPISQTIIGAEISPARRGLAMGVTQNFGSNFLGSFIAPIVLAGFAAAFGWRHAFFLAAAPALVAALLVWWLVQEPKVEADTRDRPAAGHPAGKLTLLQAFSERNILLCALLGIVMVSYMVVCLAFMPLYLTKIRSYDPQTMGWLMGTLGISASIGAFLVSGLSDRIGRRPLMIVMPLIGILVPAGALYFEGSVWMLAGIFFVGWGVLGIFPLFMATVPSESVDPLHTATVMGLCMGTCEVIGGVLSPSLAGYAADRAGLQAPLWIMIGLTVVGSLLAVGIRETAPRILTRRGLSPRPA